MSNLCTEQQIAMEQRRAGVLPADLLQPLADHVSTCGDCQAYESLMNQQQDTIMQIETTTSLPWDQLRRISFGTSVWQLPLWRWLLLAVVAMLAVVAFDVDAAIPVSALVAVLATGEANRKRRALELLGKASTSAGLLALAKENVREQLRLRRQDVWVMVVFALAIGLINPLWVAIGWEEGPISLTQHVATALLVLIYLGMALHTALVAKPALKREQALLDRA